MKEQLRRMPVVGPALAGAARVVRRQTFPGSRQYWERNYARGGDSGGGSAGRLAEAKAAMLNDFVAANDIRSVIEFGCGDGRQLALARYPRYLGLDVSVTTLRRTSAMFGADETKSFLRYDPSCFSDQAGFLTAELAVSLDVIYHLVEDETYQLHLEHVFAAATRFVVLYTSDADSLTVVEKVAAHVRHRPVVADIAAMFPTWEFVRRVPNAFAYQGTGTDTSFADFFVYERGEPRVAATPKVLEVKQRR